MPVYEFECADHGVFEDIFPVGTEEAPCPVCDKKCSRVFVTPPAVRVGLFQKARHVKRKTNGKITYW
jgi:putative FmdB family regulatory protein